MKLIRFLQTPCSRNFRLSRNVCVCVNDCPRVATRQCGGRESNRRPVYCKSSALTTRTPSHTLTTTLHRRRHGFEVGDTKFGAKRGKFFKGARRGHNITVGNTTRSSADADKPARRTQWSVKSPNIVPFHMLVFASCAIVTLSLRGAVFTIFDFKKCLDLEIGVRCHSRSSKIIPFNPASMTSC